MNKKFSKDRRPKQNRPYHRPRGKRELRDYQNRMIAPSHTRDGQAGARDPESTAE